MVRRRDGVHHDRQIAPGRILQPDRNIQTARRQAVLLVLHAPRADGNIGKQIGQVAVVVRIQHLVRAGQSVIPQGAHVQLPDGYDAAQHIRMSVRIRLVEHSLVAVAGRARLVGVDARYDEDLVLHLVRHAAQTPDILQHRLALVRRAGSDDQQKPIALPGKDVPYRLIPRPLDRRHLRRDRVPFLCLLRDGQFSVKFHVHMQVSSCFRKCESLSSYFIFPGFPAVLPDCRLPACRTFPAVRRTGASCRAWSPCPRPPASRAACQTPR